MATWWVPIKRSLGLRILVAGLFKAAHHKYVKRVPIPGKLTKTGKQRYRYFYRLTGAKGGGGIGSHEHFVVGASMRGTHEGKVGHFEVKHLHDDGRVTITHDESGKTETLHRDELVKRLHDEHASAMEAEHNEAAKDREAKKAKALSELAEARKHGASAKTIEAAKKRAKALGAEDDHLISTEELEQRREAARKSAEARKAEEEERPTDPPSDENVREAATAVAEVAPNANQSFAYSQSVMPNFLGLKTDELRIKWVDTGGQFKQAVMNESDPLLKRLGFYAALDSWSRGFWAGLVGKLLDGDATKYGVDGTRYRSVSERQKALYDQKILPKLAAWWASLTDSGRAEFCERFGDVALQTPVNGAVVKRSNFVGHEDESFTRPRGMDRMPFTPHAYQVKALNFATKHSPSKRSLLAMEMGLGKTLVGVLAFHKLREEGKVSKCFITAPSSAHGSWRQHFEDTSDARVGFVGTGLSAKKRQEVYDAFERGEFDVLVTTPDGLGGDAEAIAGMMERVGAGKVLRIADEAHLFKNPSAKRTKAFRDIMCEPPGYVVGMTGTVKPNKAEDFYHLMRGLNPRAWGPNYSLDKFGQDYCYTQFNRFRGSRGGYDILGLRPDALPRLHEENAATMFVRTQADPDVNLSIPERQDLAPRVDQDDVQTYFHEILGKSLTAHSSLARFERAAEWAASKSGWSSTLIKKVFYDFDPRYPSLASQKRMQEASGLTAARKLLKDTPENGKAAFYLTGPPNSSEYAWAAETPWGKAYFKVKAAERRYKMLAWLNGIIEEGGSASSDVIKSVGKDSEPPKTWKEAIARAANDASKNPLTAMTASLTATTDPRMLGADVERLLPDYKGTPKFHLIADAVGQHIENNPDRGAVVFGTHVKALERMKAALVERGMDPAHVYVLHGQNKASIAEAESGLNSGKYKVLVAQVDMMNAGANLQKRANFAAFIDTPPKPATITQAIARVHRQGQKARITVLRPIGSPMEARVEAMVADKIRQSTLLQGKEMSSDAALMSGIEGAGDLTHDAIETALGVKVRSATPLGAPDDMPDEGKVDAA